MRIVFIGLGGIGSNSVEGVARVFSVMDGDKQMLLVDGDAYEDKNRVRQRFLTKANKAEATLEWLGPLFPDISIDTSPEFVDEMNIHLFMKERDVVFVGVDNHATRALVLNYAETLDNILVVSGGNEEITYDVIIYERKDGKDARAHPRVRHPDIFEKGKDRNPAGMSCEERELISSGSQTFAVNFGVAKVFVDVMTFLAKKEEIPYDEVNGSWRTGNTRSWKSQLQTA